MNYLISGGTGLIGSALIDRLVLAGHQVFCVTRKPEEYKETSNLHYLRWDDLKSDSLAMDPIDVVINLAGESIGSGRWTASKKAQIESSRLQSGMLLSNFSVRQKPSPSLFIQASAVGIYGVDEQEIKDETSQPGTDYLSSVAVAWEKSSQGVEEAGIPRAIIRLGVVLDRKQGALPRMLLPFRMFAGGPLGGGKQWISWIHLEDVVRAIQYIAEHKKIGVINLVSPNPVRNAEFGKTIASILHRPYWIPAPGFALKLVLGEMSTLVLDGQKVVPDRLFQESFQFQYAKLPDALRDLLIS